LRQVLSDRDISKFPERQAWGWPGSTTGLGVDVNLPKGRKLSISGADWSLHRAETAADKVASGLGRLGYAIRKGELSW